MKMPFLVLQSFLGLALFDLVASILGFPRIHALARRFPLSKHRSRHPEARIVQAVAEACVWYPKRAFCLQRSWVASLLLRRHGIPSQVVIGYRPAPLDSHAWVEVEGQVVNDRPQYQKFYAVLDRL
jgi:hypothetical protein